MQRFEIYGKLENGFCKFNEIIKQRTSIENNEGTAYYIDKFENLWGYLGLE